MGVVMDILDLCVGEAPERARVCVCLCVTIGEFLRECLRKCERVICDFMLHIVVETLAVQLE